MITPKWTYEKTIGAAALLLAKKWPAIGFEVRRLRARYTEADTYEIFGDLNRAMDYWRSNNPTDNLIDYDILYAVQQMIEAAIVIKTNIESPFGKQSAVDFQNRRIDRVLINVPKELKNDLTAE